MIIAIGLVGVSYGKWLRWSWKLFVGEFVFSAAMMLLMVAIISISAIVMGSGNAPFFAFASLTPAVAAHSGLHPVLMLLPMHFAASIMRNCSPITAVIVVSSGMGGVSSFDLVKRTAIPMAGAMLCNVGMTFFYYYTNW